MEYIKKYTCNVCNNILAKKTKNGEIENTLSAKIRVDESVVTLICLKCKAKKILYLKKIIWQNNFFVVNF